MRREEHIPSFLTGASLLHGPPGSHNSVEAQGNFSVGEAMGQNVRNGEVAPKKPGFLGRNRKEKGGSRGTEIGQVPSVQEKFQSPTVSRELGHAKESSRSPFVGEEGADRNPSPHRRKNRPLPCGVLPARQAERPRSGRASAGKAESGEEAGKKSDPARGRTAGQEPDHVRPGPAKYS